MLNGIKLNEQNKSLISTNLLHLYLLVNKYPLFFEENLPLLKI